jgi:glucose-6-phosphate 1-dehydrogenase
MGGWMFRHAEDADAVRDEQAKVLNAIQPLSSEDPLHQTVRGQDGEGFIQKERKCRLIAPSQESLRIRRPRLL